MKDTDPRFVILPNGDMVNIRSIDNVRAIASEPSFVGDHIIPDRVLVYHGNGYVSMIKTETFDEAVSIRDRIINSIDVALSGNDAITDSRDADALNPCSEEQPC